MTNAQRQGITGFFTAEQSRLLSYIRRRLSANSERDAEDILQDVMIKVSESADINAPVEKLASYVYTAIRNRLIDFFRTKKDHLSLDELSETSDFSLTSILQEKNTAIDPDFQEALYRAINSLEPNERAVVIATEFEDITFSVLSQETGEPIGTLLSRKARAIEKIRKKMIEGGFTHGT